MHARNISKQPWIAQYSIDYVQPESYWLPCWAPASWNGWLNHAWLAVFRLINIWLMAVLHSQSSWSVPLPWLREHSLWMLAPGLYFKHHSPLLTCHNIFPSNSQTSDWKMNSKQLTVLYWKLQSEVTPFNWTKPVLPFVPVLDYLLNQKLQQLTSFPLCIISEQRQIGRASCRERV